MPTENTASSDQKKWDRIQRLSHPGTAYEIALDEFRTAAMDYEDEMWDQFGVNDAPAAKEMWKMIKTLEDMQK